MAKYRKRLEALSEIYRSEVLYVEDLKIWAEDFRRDLFHSETLTIEKKHALSKTLFINLDSIIALHEIIIDELHRRNSMMAKQQGIALQDKDGQTHITEEIAEKYKDLEYHSVYYKYLDRFNSYKHYVSRLPTVEFNLDKECSQNIGFARELAMFFQSRDINLGPKHFIYRASQKLARYSILWKAVLHYEENPTYRSGIEELMKRLKEITLDVDKTYGNINESYRVYRFSSELHYSNNIKKRIPLNLFQKKRTIIKESDIIVKDKNITEAKLLRFILLDTVVLLCDVVRQGNIELKYIISDPMPLYKYTVTDKNIGFSIENQQLMDMSKLFMLEIGGRDIIVLFFSNTNTRNIYKNIISEAINKQRESFSSNIEIRKILEQTNVKIQCCATRQTNIGHRNRLSRLFHFDEDKKEKDFAQIRFKPEQMSDFQKSIIKIVKRPHHKKKHHGRNVNSTNKTELGKGVEHGAESSDTSLKNMNIVKNDNKNENNNTMVSAKSDPFSEDLDDTQVSIKSVRPENFQDAGMPCHKSTGDQTENTKDRNEITNNQHEVGSKDNSGTETQHDIVKTEEGTNSQVESGSENILSIDEDSEKKSISQLKTEFSNIFTDSSESSSGCVCNFKDENVSTIKKSYRHGRELHFETKIHREQSPESSSDSIDNEIGGRRKSLFGRFFQKPKSKTRSRSFAMNKTSLGIQKFDEELLLFGTDEGLFSKKHTEYKNLYEDPVEKLIYDGVNKIICFLSEGKIKVASFVPTQTSLDTKTIANNVSNFFYGSIANKLTIASLVVTTSSTTTISLFKIELKNDIISVVMDRKLFVGCLVFEIAFFETMLIIACKDFEMVDSDTLKTQELVDPLDLCIPFYFKELKTVTALCVFTISKNLYLVCYDTMGFFIDKFGRTVKQDTIFVWYFTPCKFRIYKGFIVCLGEHEIAIWTLPNAKIVYNKKIENLNFVEGAKSLLLHDEHNMYKIDL